MRHVLGDFMNVASAGMVVRETIQKWHEDVEYVVLLEVVDTFQLQFTKPDGTRLALSYTVRDDGTILETSKAGGIDFHCLPPGTKPSIVISYRRDAKNLDKMWKYLQARGWTTGASLVDGVVSRDRAFSKSGFGIERGTVGEW
jgi:hypothetical protein